ncbi:hypothetical protein UA08_07511 [Talaromyces atroroseus]|uniref:NADH:ubiquinone oxidoreductase intermediate-associated protein 30 domain-containing protein n=1 Tax=Talaromyces atroroseus TaxID=1441469 RepID=A0A225A904_TALAT|nr:hypothetical protein UA08_07511 [Talaromyces atroroseus]OKL57291.1 hypothetical protein UA08_07511 [Talaromyces atroroseus]
MASISRKYLFGGDKRWSTSDWTACDDRVRGGASISYLAIKSSTTTITNPEQNQDQPENESNSVLFYGKLDASTLGGAGFASHRNKTNTIDWNLADYDGIELQIGESDGKRYVFIIKDEILPKRPDGRNRTSVNWEYEFVIPSSETMREGNVVRLRWKDFRPTYRGRLKDDLKRELNVAGIKRVTIMMRSFFGYQEGGFELEIKSIAAFKEEEEDSETTLPAIQDTAGQQEAGIDREAAIVTRAESARSRPGERQRPGSLLRRLWSACCGY